ncbi:eukaryotic translation initiation factor 3 subunit E-B isoform X2 [Hyalella azteca]|uniref:Eukaryotic translation initiation factor 3 subunit E n=1 Tax=Hyalella azteca TaxID=294128 RepID=A0A8B7N4H6_HYAAZ|nr:eukaryotic translation initiation factor 3 subunit E-B isoform X2 [Hyalella azteca]
MCTSDLRSEHCIRTNSNMAQYDLTNKLTPYLDRHLVFPLMEFLSVRGIYNETDLQRTKLDLLSNTNMVDFAMDIQASLYPDQPPSTELTEKRSRVVAELKRLQTESAQIFDIFADPEVQKQVQSSRDYKTLVNYLQENHKFKPEMLDVVFKYAKFQYECGNYSATADYMYLFRCLVPPTDKNYLSSLWGKLATEILTQDWENALDDLNRLKEVLDSGVTTSTPLQALQQRTWLIHWSLFVFFNHTKGRELIIEMLLYQTQYLNAIQTMCPHVLRYLATAVVINKSSRRQALRDLVKVIQQENYNYSDPITEFLASLYVDFDFDAAQEKLQLCADVLKNDFFLVACMKDFIDNARLMIFELFCRIHQCISINMLAEKLNMTPPDAERWIVDLIRQAKLDAKIDSQQGHVVMGTQAISPYQQLIEKTKNLSFRTQMLAMNIEKKANTARSNEAYSDMH